MKKTVFTFIFILCITHFSSSSQNKDKYSISTQIGLAGIDGGKTDGFSHGINIEYRLWKRIGVVAGLSNIRSNNYPSKNGVIETGIWGNNPSSNLKNQGALYDYIYHQYLTGNLTTYHNYSFLAIDFGLTAFLMDQEKNSISINLKGLYADQNSSETRPKEVNAASVTVTSTHQRFSGLGYNFGITYRRKISGRMWAGIYGRNNHFFTETPIHYFDMGIDVSVRF